MRYNVKIETLSSVHIGSGDKKVLGIDFLFTPERIYFLDTKKIGESLNIASNPKIAEKWSESILAGNQKTFLETHNIDFKSSSRKVVNSVYKFSDRSPSISMMMRDGRGIAYIPGSSIKGAIRTALFAQLVSKDEINKAYLEAKKKASLEYDKKKKDRILEDTLSSWANNFFGEITEDSFRFLRIGDAFFRNASMAVINTVQIKKDSARPRNAKFDTIKQYAEVLLLENTSHFSLDIDSEGLAKELLKQNNTTRDVPQLKNITSLFKSINSYTQSLVQSELKNWEKIMDAESLYDFLDFIDGEIDACSEEECILRIGSGSGKRFITGGIHERMTFDKEPIPKTRRIEVVNEKDEDEHYELLGFVKLSLEK